MARVPETDGRTVRNINGNILEEAADTQAFLEEAIRSLSRPMGSTDPVVYLRAQKLAQEHIADALESIRGIVTLANNIEQICALAAQRGAKDKESE